MRRDVEIARKKREREREILKKCGSFYEVLKLKKLLQNFETWHI